MYGWAGGYGIKSNSVIEELTDCCFHFIIAEFIISERLFYTGNQILTMTSDQSNGTAAKKHPNAQLAGIYDTVLWLFVALILALFFRCFIMEAYPIPTGSMAGTLKGSHFRLYCPQCGFEFDRNFDPLEYKMAKDTLPKGGKEKPSGCRCPSCGHDIDYKESQWVTNGDRILVLKCIYQFNQPCRWDVIVFREPTNPHSNVIKRLIAKPGEIVSIIDGDIYIDGKISRKPDHLQQKMWIPVYLDDYQPVKPDGFYFNGHDWKRPLKNLDGSAWSEDSNEPTAFVLNVNDKLHWLKYDSTIGNSFKAFNSYNPRAYYYQRPYCSDLKVRFLAHRNDKNAKVGAQIDKYGISYRGWIEDGNMFISRAADDKVEQLVSRPIRKAMSTKPVMVSFYIVDHRIVFEYGKDGVSYDLGPGTDDAGYRNVLIEPQAKVFGSGSLKISHLAIFRDIHYTVGHYFGDKNLVRGAGSEGFTLGDNEYFVLGDNSTDSFDSRWWNEPGLANNDQGYRPGIVPADYLVGKAVFVYWPGGFRPFEGSPAVVPNIKKMRFIKGGSGH